VASLATAVAGLCEGYEGSSAVDVHWNTGGECARRGVHCCRGRSGGGMRAEEGEQGALGSRVCHRRWSGMSEGTSWGIMEGLICEAIEVQTMSCLKPAVEVPVLRSVSS
jgi:hypothetical protein